MGFLIGCCLMITTFNPLSKSFDITQQIFKNPINFVESFFIKSPLPTQTRKTKSYTIALVGDSMTQFFGTADPFNNALKKYYPGKEFGILNFGIGATNILSVPDRLKKETKRLSETLPPVLSTRPDIILLESFGNNPLSQFPLKEGLKKQEETLDQIVKIIKEKSPQTVLVFYTTVSPFKDRYAEGVTILTTEERRKWANERIAYIKNHAEYAKAHKIPLIDGYEKSLNEKGEPNIDYINTNDFIHPSVTGIQFLSDTLADKIFSSQIIPN